MMKTFLLKLFIFLGIMGGVLSSKELLAGPPAQRNSSGAREWWEAKFQKTPSPQPPISQMTVTLRSGSLQKNRRRDRTFLIAGQPYEKGIAMPSTGEIQVYLSDPALTFEAVAGVDSNDLGYYSNAGRGGVRASVFLEDQELFQSGTLREGIPGIPVRVDLAGANRFKLKLEAAGERSPTYQAEWDQLDWADARVTMKNGEILWLADLPLGPLPGPFSTEPPFSFRYQNRPSGDFLSSWLTEQSSQELDPYRSAQTIRYTDSTTGLQVRAAAVAYRDFPVVEWTLYFKNNGTQPTPILENIMALETSFQRTPEIEYRLHHFAGSPNSPTDFQPMEAVLGPKTEKRLSAKGGRPTDTDLCFFNLEWASQGVIIALGWPGQWTAGFKRDDQTGIRIQAGQELTHLRLLPGEEIRTPLIALLFWEGDWLQAQNIWRRWMIAHNMPRPAGKLPPPQLAGGSNRHTIEMQDANEENQLFFLHRDLDAGLPLDYWWMDAGWYPFKKGWWSTGTWEPDPLRFPRGFTPISNAAHQRQVKTIVWFEPERVTPGSWLDEHHPEWLLGPAGKNRLLYLGNPEARQWITDQVSRLIQEQGIDLYRQDFNFEPLSLWRANDAEDRQGITEIKHVTGYLTYWDELHQRFPNLPIDTCASGGRRDDLETLRRAVPLWRSDFAYEPAAMQQLTYGMSFWIPYFGSAFNSLDPYIFFSQITPATAIGLEAGRQPNGYPRMLSLISQWRQIANYYYGDYYPLTPYRTGSAEWMAWQFNRPEKGDGIVQAFRRPDSPFERARLALRGLEMDATYTIMLIDSPEKSILSGKELKEQGLSVFLPKRPQAAVIFYKKENR